jgi:putative peptidoglycan lipid II flippase
VRFLVRLVTAVAISAGAAWGLREGMGQLLPDEGKLNAVLTLAVVGLAFLAIYLGLSRILRISEVTDVMRLLTRRLSRRR